MEEGAVNLGTLLSIVIPLFACLIGLGAMTIATKTTVANKVDSLEKRDAELHTDLERLRVEVKSDVEKIQDSKLSDVIQFTDALAKFNVVLNEIRITMEGVKISNTHTEVTLRNVTDKLEKLGDRVAIMEREK